MEDLVAKEAGFWKGFCRGPPKSTKSVMKERARRTEIILVWTGLDWVGDARVLASDVAARRESGTLAGLCVDNVRYVV